MENGDLPNKGVFNNHNHEIINCSAKKEVNHCNGEKHLIENNLNINNGLVQINEEVDGRGGNRKSHYMVDKESANPAPELAFSKSNLSNLNSSIVSGLKLSVQTLDSVKSDLEPYHEKEKVPQYQKKRKRLIIRAVFLLCLAGALQGILVNGLINVVISSIEKR